MGENLINGFIHKLFILVVGNVDTGTGLHGYINYCSMNGPLKMSLFFNL